MAEEKPSGERVGTRRRIHHRRYGYRGYGSGFDRGTKGYGGAVHWGQGFGGVGFPGSSGGTILPQAGLLTAEVWQQGPYAGLAPKGYSRSDDRIREDICDELTRRPDIDPGRLTVSVRDAEVTLEGTVRDLDSRRLVDDIASRCVGVRQVHNQLGIERAKNIPSTTANGSKRPSRK